jgi:hypothetical protein
MSVPKQSAEFLEAYRAFRKLKPDLTKEEFDPYFEEYVAVKPIDFYLRRYGEAKNLDVKKVGGDVLLALQKVFNQYHVAELFRVTSATISLRGKDTKESRETARDLEGITKLELDEDVFKNYFAILDTMLQIVNKGTNVGDRNKAAVSLLQYYEPKVIDELKKSKANLEALFELVVNRLIPEASKRIREILRQYNIPKEAHIDLRLIFKEILPNPSEIKEYLAKKGLA